VKCARRGSRFIISGVERAAVAWKVDLRVLEADGMTGCLDAHVRRIDLLSLICKVYFLVGRGPIVYSLIVGRELIVIR
jgi:hypothetical protein